MKEQGQVLCAGPAANPGEVHREAAETAVTRPWEPATRGHAGSRWGAGSEGPDVLLRAAGGEGLALPRRHPGPQPPGVTPTDRVHWSGARGLPLKTSFSAEFDGRRRCGLQPCPSLSCLPGLLSGKACLSLLQRTQGPCPPQGRSGARSRPPCPVAVICSDCLGLLLSKAPHRAEGAVRGSHLPRTRRLVL